MTDTATALPKFPDAKFYDCGDPEVLNYETPEEAIEQYLDNDAEPGCDMVALIRKWSPVTVTAYVPQEVTDKEIERWADDLVENLWEKWAEERSDPDGSPFDGFPKNAEEVMREAVRTIARGATAWACRSVGSVKLDAEQVETLMRQHRPDWFKEPTP